MQSPVVELLEYSSTLPELPEPNIPLDSTVISLANRLGPNNRMAVLVGPVSSGKTVHLTQFVRHFPGQCFSYFLTDNFWLKRRESFLHSLCTQMSVALDRSPLDGELDSVRLETLFYSLFQKVVDKARRQKQIYYFVLDGLENAITGEPGERIIDILPLPTAPNTVYFLGSVQSGQEYRLIHEYKWEEVHLFSTLETHEYLKDLRLQQKEVAILHQKAGGVPGYLAAVRSLVQQGIEVDKILNSPAEIMDLLAIQWQSAKIENDPIKEQIFALLAFAITPLDEQSISDIVGITSAEVKIFTSGKGMVRESVEGKGIELYNELLKQIAQERLRHWREKTLKSVIDHYTHAARTPQIDLLLTQYYFESRDFDAVSNQLVTSNIVRMIESHQDLTVTKRILSRATEMAVDNHSPYIALKFGIATSELQTLGDEIVGESEVIALVALGRFDEALELAYSAKLAQTRIKLLSKIYIEKRRKGQFVSLESISEIERMVQQISEKVEQDDLTQLAISMFPLLPDAAMTLLEKGQQGEQSRSMFDLLLTAATISGEDYQTDKFVEQIQDADLRGLALSTNAWLVRLSAEDVITRAKEAELTKTKEYLLRNWCLQNTEKTDLHKVVEAALDVIISDPSYNVPLRYLRQLSGVLRFCIPESRLALANRFDIPNFTSLKVPVEERIRLELNLADGIVEISDYAAASRFIDTYSNFDEQILDMDVACYCYVRFLVTLKSIDPLDTIELLDELQQKIIDTFERLIEHSADQWAITKRIIRALAITDPTLGMQFGEKLNTMRRRELALEEIAVVQMRRDQGKVDTNIIDSCLQKISSINARDETLLRLVKAASASGRLNTDVVRQYLITVISQVIDPIKRADGLSYIIGGITDDKDESLKLELFEKLKVSRENIDILWMRVSSAFHQVQRIATNDKALAGQLYDEAQILRDSSSLATSNIGTIYYRLLDLSTRAVRYLNLQNDDSKTTMDHLYSLISYIPSSLLQAHLFARLAFSRFRNGDKATFDYLMSEKVMPTLRVDHKSDTYHQVITSCGIAIFEYSRIEARTILSLLPYARRNSAWFKTAMLILLGANIDDPIETELERIVIDSPKIDKVLEVLDCIEADGAFSPVLSAFCDSLENSRSTLSENQSLDYLGKLSALVNKKLPDKRNILHDGYLLVCKGRIERARLKVAKRSKSIIKPQFNATIKTIVKGAESISNFADRVLVMASIAEDLVGLDDQLAKDVIDKAYELVKDIPDAIDRSQRLNTIADVLRKQRHTSSAQQAIQMAFDILKDLRHVGRESVIASVIQTAHEIDKEFAAALTEKVTQPQGQYVVAKQMEVLKLSASPNRIDRCLEDPFALRHLPDAAQKMLKLLVAGRGVSYTNHALESTLRSLRLLKFEDAITVSHWLIEVFLRQGAQTSVPREANLITQAIMQCASLVLELGNRIAFLSTVPTEAKQGFQGLASKVQLFRAGEREVAIKWISEWLKSNAKDYVKIYEPYFDLEQLWILQHIPIDIQVILVTTWSSLQKLKTLSSSEVKSAFEIAWSSYSTQDPPATLVVIEDSHSNNDAHDRYLVTKEHGLSIGTSLNGIGNKAFSINVLMAEDARKVESDYISPRIEGTELLKKTFFKL